MMRSVTAGLFFTALSMVDAVEMFAFDSQAPLIKIDGLNKSIQEVLNETKTPGAAVVLVSADQILHFSGVGFADLSTKRLVTEQTMFRAGSISKSFTALACLICQERGLVELNARIRDLAPEVKFSNSWENSDPVLLTNLLEHTAGFDEISLREFATSIPDSQLSKDINFDPAPRTSRWRPGKFFSYSNADYSVAGYVLEKITNKKFDDIMSDELLGPLEMTTASFLRSDNVERLLATGYKQDGVSPSDYEHIIGRPSGALNCSPMELAHLVQLFLNRGTYKGIRLLKTESIQRMETPATTVMARNGILDGYGLANYTTSHKRHRIHGHAGGMNGYLAVYGYSIEHGVGYVVMLNGSSGEALHRIERLTLDCLSSSWPESQTAAAMPFLQDQFTTYLGYYEPYTLRVEKSRFLMRLMTRRQVDIRNGKLYSRGLFGTWEELLPSHVERAFATHEDAGPTQYFFTEPDNIYLACHKFGLDNFRKIPIWQFWFEMIAVSYCCLMTFGIFIFSMIWLLRSILGYDNKESKHSLIAIPLLASLSLVGFFGVFVYSLTDPVNMLARPTPWSTSLWLFSWSLTILTVLGIVNLSRTTRTNRQSWIWRLSFLASIANGIALLYLGYWGLIGIRTWA